MSKKQQQENAAIAKQEVAVREAQEAQEAQPGHVPAWLQNVEVPNQADNFTQDDAIVPQIRIVQNNPELMAHFPDAQMGQFWHHGADENLGRSFTFVVCSRRRRYLLVSPEKDDQGVLARSDDGITWDKLGRWEVKISKDKTAIWEVTDLNVVKSGLAVWGSSEPGVNNSPPAATLFYEQVVLLPDHLHLGPVAISLARSAVRKAKRGLNDKIAMMRAAGRPMQSLLFEASVVPDSSGDKSFFNWQFKGQGFCTEEVYKRACDIYEAMNSVFIVQDEAQSASVESLEAGEGEESAKDDIPF